MNAESTRCTSSPCIAIFMSRGMTLQRWREIGMIDRELALYGELMRRGIRVSLVTYDTRREAVRDAEHLGVCVLWNRLRMPSAAYARAVPLLHWRALRRCCIMRTNQVSGGDVALRSARAVRRPLVARCGYLLSDFMEREHGSGSPEHVSAMRQEAQLFSSASRVVVTTEAMRRDVARRLPTVSPRIRVIPNFVEVSRFVPSTRIAPDVDVVYVGRIAPQKNVDALLGAVRLVGATALIIGDGPERASLVERYGDLRDSVEWHSAVRNRDLPAMLHRARVFVLPSHYEGHPKALLEAMAAGLPVVGADSSGIRVLIADGKTGLLCAPTSQAVAARIRRLLDDSVLRTRLGRAGQRYVIENFDLESAGRLEQALADELVVDAAPDEAGT